jgi:hypothetical protein
MQVTAEDICSDIAYSMFVTRHGMTEEQVGQLWKNLGLYIASCLKCGKVWKSPKKLFLPILCLRVYVCGAVLHTVA